jgi:ABC-type amino acid transport substrate-binding protein
MEPIKPSQSLEADIQSVKSLFREDRVIEVMGKPNTCLDPRLYQLENDGAKINLVDIKLAELVPALIAGESESTLLDVPDALIALQKWTGKIKIIGPVTEVQQMGCVFSKGSPELKKAFNDFFNEFKISGEYRKLVEKYYPNVFGYFPEFFNHK